MPVQPSNPNALSEAELNRLADLLDAIDQPAMSLEMVDGFFTALLCAPEFVAPSEWLPEIWGPNYDFGKAENEAEISELLIKHWNAVGLALLCTLDGTSNFMPVLFETDEGFSPANDWASGFVAGMDLRPEPWDELLHDRKRLPWLAPVLLLHHEDNPDPSLRTTVGDADERDLLIEDMVGGVIEVYRHFEKARHDDASRERPVPLRRAEPKVGRNDPCPCDSGKKYKQCCRAAG